MYFHAFKLIVCAVFAWTPNIEGMFKHDIIVIITLL